MASINLGDVGTILGDLTGGGNVADDLNEIAQRNLEQAAAQNVQIPRQNPNVVPGPGATSSIPARTALVNGLISANTKWLVGGALLLALFLVMKRGK
jgi:hypothetical protein